MINISGARRICHGLMTAMVAMFKSVLQGSKCDVMKSCLTIAMLLALAGFCQGQPQTTAAIDLPSADRHTDSTREISYRVITIGAGGFGYDILVNGKIYIHQTTVPAVPGIVAFVRKEDAEKVARLVVVKIEQGIMPPAVTKAEMEALGWQDQ